MSNLLPISFMVAECQARVPIGLSSSFWTKKLNEAYRWISQKGNFIWDVKLSYVTVNATQNYFPIPSDCDPGKPMYLAGPYYGVSAQTGNMLSTIPYRPWDETLDQQFAEVTAPPGLFSCWTFHTNFSIGAAPTYTPTFAYRGMLYPASAIPTVATGAFQFNLAYHTDVSGIEYSATPSASIPNYFPTPNSFDTLLIELAEAEVRRIYGLAGWDIIQKRAESAIVNLLDAYRSTKNVLSGLTDQQKQAGEKKMMAQERS